MVMELNKMATPMERQAYRKTVFAIRKLELEMGTALERMPQEKMLDLFEQTAENVIGASRILWKQLRKRYRLDPAKDYAISESGEIVEGGEDLWQSTKSVLPY